MFSAIEASSGRFDRPSSRLYQNSGIAPHAILIVSRSIAAHFTRSFVPL